MPLEQRKRKRSKIAAQCSASASASAVTGYRISDLDLLCHVIIPARGCQWWAHTTSQVKHGKISPDHSPELVDDRDHDCV
jgi:hypothetical protein